MRYRASVSNGRGSLRHNNREFVAENVDRDRIKDNITLERMSLVDAYNKAYGQSIEEHNKQQKRKDRMLTVDKYIKRIEMGQGKKNNPKLFYETIVQIGDIDTAGIKKQPKTAEEMKKILACYFKDFEERTAGHILIFNATIHMDEATPHLHIDWIPLGRGFRKGMPVRNSLEKAIGQMGFELPNGVKNKTVNNRAKWQEYERDRLCEIAKSRGIEAFWERHDESELKLTPQQFKKLMRVFERELMKQYDMHKDETEQIANELKRTSTFKRIFSKSELLDKGLEAVAKTEVLAKMMYEAKQQELSESIEKERKKVAIEAKHVSIDKEKNRSRELELNSKEIELAAQAKQNQETTDKNAEELAKLESMRRENERLHNEAMRALALAEEKEKTAIKEKKRAEQLSLELRDERTAYELDKSKWKSIQEANESERKQYARAEHNKRLVLEWKECYTKYHKQSSDIIANQADKIQQQKTTIDTLNQDIYIKDRKLQSQQTDNKRIGEQLSSVNYYAATLATENRILHSIVDKMGDGLSAQQKAAIKLACAETAKANMPSDVKLISQKISDNIMLSVASIRDTVKQQAPKPEQSKAPQQKPRGIHRSHSHDRDVGR